MDTGGEEGRRLNRNVDKGWREDDCFGCGISRC